MARKAADRPQKTTVGKRTALPTAPGSKEGEEEGKASVIRLRHLRLRVVDIELTDALEVQRCTPWPDLSRRIYQHGCLIEAASGPPDEDGKYGTFSGERLAQLLAGDVETLITFLMRFGHIPTVIKVLIDLVQKHESLPPSLIGWQEASAASPALAGLEPMRRVEDGAVESLDIFFQSEGN